MTLSHVDENARPTMVDVSGKQVTHRIATAESRVRFPSAVADELAKNGFNTSKGPVFHTAIIAGTMAAKRTHELIPFCHPLGIENCKVHIEMQGAEHAFDTFPSVRSEERRVGKECRSRWSPYH